MQLVRAAVQTLKVMMVGQVNHLGEEGLLKKVIAGHYSLAPRIQKLALENKIAAYNMPQGCLSELFREIAAQADLVF